MAAIAALFYVELFVVLLSISVHWPLYISQLLAWRFTPHRRWNITKVSLVCTGLVALCVETCRSPDMSTGFGLISKLAQRLLYQQLGCILLLTLIIVMLATAKSLYAQMQKQVPRIFTRLLWGTLLCHQLLLIPVIVGSIVARKQNDTSTDDWLMRWWAFMNVEFMLVAVVLLVVYWFLYVGLRRKVSAFLTTLEAQEGKKREVALLAAASPTAAPVAAAKRTPLLVVVASEQIDQSPPVSPSPSPSPDDAEGKPLVPYPASPNATSAHVAPAPASATPVHAPAASRDQADARISDLKAALRKMKILTTAVTCLLIGPALLPLGPLLEWLADGVPLDSIVVERILPGEPFPVGNLISTCMTQAAFAIIVWYAWTSPRPWMAATRRELGLSFWHTVRHGVDEQAYDQAMARRGMGLTVGAPRQKVEVVPNSHRQSPHAEASPVVASSPSAGADNELAVPRRTAW